MCSSVLSLLVEEWLSWIILEKLSLATIFVDTGKYIAYTPFRFRGWSFSEVPENPKEATRKWRNW